MAISSESRPGHWAGILVALLALAALPSADAGCATGDPAAARAKRYASNLGVWNRVVGELEEAQASTLEMAIFKTALKLDSEHEHLSPEDKELLKEYRDAMWWKWRGVWDGTEIPNEEQKMEASYITQLFLLKASRKISLPSEDEVRREALNRAVRMIFGMTVAPKEEPVGNPLLASSAPQVNRFHSTAPRPAVQNPFQPLPESTPWGGQMNDKEQSDASQYANIGQCPQGRFPGYYDNTIEGGAVRDRLLHPLFRLLGLNENQKLVLRIALDPKRKSKDVGFKEEDHGKDAYKAMEKFRKEMKGLEKGRFEMGRRDLFMSPNDLARDLWAGYEHTRKMLVKYGDDKPPNDYQLAVLECIFNADLMYGFWPPR